GADLFELGGMKCGLQICYDLDFPELARVQALSGADGVIVLSPTPAPYTVVPRHLVPARAYGNQLFGVFATRTRAARGRRDAGGLCVAAADGGWRAACGQEDALACALLEPARDAGCLGEHRFGPHPRPQLYVRPAPPGR